MRRALLLAFATAVAVAAAGCGGESALHNARLSGLVKLCGGPANKCFTEPMRVSIIGTNHRVVADSHPLNGRFSFELASGMYTVSAAAGGFVIGTVSARAVKGRTTYANITNGNVR
jgi:hypothetical protein